MFLSDYVTLMLSYQNGRRPATIRYSAHTLQNGNSIVREVVSISDYELLMIGLGIAMLIVEIIGLYKNK